MMICISTSNNLRDSILHRAGPEIESQYQRSAKLDDALLLDGGSTRARKILFVPWQTEIEETSKTQKSLSELVKWCIEQAKQRDLKSISFPPVRGYSFFIIKINFLKRSVLVNLVLIHLLLLKR
jgi:hypothetical protein